GVTRLPTSRRAPSGPLSHSGSSPRSAARGSLSTSSRGSATSSARQGTDSSPSSWAKRLSKVTVDRAAVLTMSTLPRGPVAAEGSAGSGVLGGPQHGHEEVAVLPERAQVPGGEQHIGHEPGPLGVLQELRERVAAAGAEAHGRPAVGGQVESET